MAKRHKWKPNPNKPKNRWCEECGLAEVVERYRYLSPRHGYRDGFRRYWYHKARVVAEGQRIPFDCPGSRDAPTPFIPEPEVYDPDRE